MPPTTRYSFGDIVLVPFPFTDQSGTKQRPAVVISSAAYHQARRDVLIMAVTSQARPGMHGEVEVKHWQDAGLIKASVIKPVIATIEAPLIIRRLGQLETDDQQALRQAINQIVG